jgi:hypothetical protein
MPFVGAPATPAMHRAIEAMSTFRDAPEFTENILNISNPEPSIYSMRKLDLTHAVTAKRLLVAKKYVGLLFRECQVQGPNTVAVVNKTADRTWPSWRCRTT